MHIGFKPRLQKLIPVDALHDVAVFESQVAEKGAVDREQLDSDGFAGAKRWNQAAARVAELRERGLDLAPHNQAGRLRARRHGTRNDERSSDGSRNVSLRCVGRCDGPPREQRRCGPREPPGDATHSASESVEHETVQRCGQKAPATTNIPERADRSARRPREPATCTDVALIEAVFAATTTAFELSLRVLLSAPREPKPPHHFVDGGRTVDRRVCPAVSSVRASRSLPAWFEPGQLQPMLFLTLIAAQIVSPPTAPNRTARVAVYEVSAAPGSERVADVVTASIVAELRKLDGLSVIGMDEVRAMLDLEAQKQLVGCGDDSCLAEIAAALGVDIVIVGSIATVGDESVFGLRRIEQATATVKGQVNQRLVPADGEEFLGVVGASIEALFPDHALKKGASRGVAPEMAVRLRPPPFHPAVFWSGVGVTGVGIAASSVVTALWVSAEDEIATLAGATESKDFVAATQHADDLRALTIGAWSATGVVAVAAAWTAIFVDWEGAGDPVHVQVVE